MVINVHIDGASWSKKLSSVGIVVELPSSNVRISQRLSIPWDARKQDSNRPEYLALLTALRYALLNGHRNLKVLSDSEIVVNQINGTYKCQSNLRPVYKACKSLIRWFESFEIEHISRRDNSDANELARMALVNG